MKRTWFITGTNTNVGKTAVARAISYACRARGLDLAAIKPLETGCNPEPHDAIMLAEACGRPALANAPGLYRARAPLAPYAATLSGEQAPPSIAALTQRVTELVANIPLALIEGASGLLVPVNEKETLADLADALHASLIVVARNELGVLSQTLTLVESARARKLPIAAIVLNQSESHDASQTFNLRILKTYAPEIPVLEFPRTEMSADALLRVAQESELLPTLLRE